MSPLETTRGATGSWGGPAGGAPVGRHLAKLAQRLEAVETAAATPREDRAKAAAADPKATAADLMMVGKAEGKPTTRVSSIERDVRAYGEGVAEALGEEVTG
ncbi:MAG: hypothetical protein IPO67_28595 [Deltaproteobacteria bacterium]|nr:hypothetical protein [Deltaproteobacteria bacterium]